MTLKLEGNIGILKMYLHTENEVASLKHSKLLTVEVVTRSEVKGKCHQLSTTSSVNYGTSSYQVTSISDQ